MIYEKIKLSDLSDARLHIYIPDQTLDTGARDCLLVIPGGGYSKVCGDREGEPIALRFMTKGMITFVLEYSVGEKARFPLPLQEAALAMKYIRENAEKYKVKPDRVFAVGFSAGGHLTASLGSLYGCEAVQSLPGMTEELARPTGTVLVYPVISGVDSPHLGSFKNLLGKQEPTTEELARYSIERCVTEKTVPAFLVHTAADKTVPVRNCLVMAEALNAHGIPFELHIFPNGAHGLALANDITARTPASICPEFAQWPELAYDWICRQ